MDVPGVVAVGYHPAPPPASATRMELSNRHNLRQLPPEPTALHFGIRVTMPALDPLRQVLGNDWHTEHWYASAAERDAALVEIGKRHAYSRIGDRPSIRLETLER